MRLPKRWAWCSLLTFHIGIVKLDFKRQLGRPMLSHPLPLDAVAFDFPELKICIAHMGGNYLYTALTLAEKHEHVYLDTAFLGFLRQGSSLKPRRPGSSVIPFPWQATAKFSTEAKAYGLRTC